MQSYFYFSDAEQTSVLGGEDNAGISGGNYGKVAGINSDDNPADYGDDADDDYDGDNGDDEDDDGSHVHHAGGKDQTSSQVRSRARDKAKACGRGRARGMGRARVYEQTMPTCPPCSDFETVHMPVYSDTTKKNCVVCYREGRGQLRVYSYCSAPQCGKYLHVTKDKNCFREWHNRAYHGQ